MTLRWRSSYGPIAPGAAVTVARLAPLVLLAAFLDCTSFSPLLANTCGNGVVDSNEDCDTFARGATACRPPNAVGACRLDCSATPCPAGYGCGTDDICRQPTGRFARTGVQIAAGAWRFLAGDFDGDRRQDLVTREPLDPGGQSRMRVHYFDGNAALAKTLIIPPALASPSVIDVNADQRADLVFSALGTLGNTLGGIGTMLGQADRTLSPVAYPSFTFPDATRLIPFHGLNLTTSFAFYAKHNNVAAFGFVDAVGTSTPLVVLPTTADPTAQSFATGRLYEDGNAYPCEEAVFALPKASEVLVYPICKNIGGTVVVNETGVADLVHVKLPPNLVVEHGVRVADADGDGHLDLLIGALAGMPPTLKTYIAYGTGDRGFKSSPTGAVDDKADIFRINTTQMEDYEPGLPLAVGDMNADGRPDFVTPTLLLTSVRGTGAPPGGDGGADGGFRPLRYFVAGQKARGTWTDAAIADFNGNGYPDAIAGSNATLDLDFFNGNGSEAFSTFSLTTNGPSTSFSVADVDGDYLPDLVFAQTSSSGDQLAIAYGRSDGAPNPPISVGVFQNILQTVTFDPGAPVSDIVVVDHSLDPKNASTAISFLAGTGDRDPLALFNLSHPKVVADVPLGVVPGAFSKPGNVDIVAVGDDLDPISHTLTAAFRLWLAKAAAPASPATSPQLSTPLDGPKLRDDATPIINTDSLFGVSLLLAQGDVDRDGTPNVVMVTPLSQVGDGSNSQLTIARPRADTMALDVVATVPLGVPAATDGQLAVVDVDRDGAPDIVVLGGPEGAFVLVTYWNDGKGGFDAKVSTTMNLKGEAPTGFTFVGVGKDEPPALAYVTAHTVVIAHLDTKDRNAIRREKIDVPKDATGIIAADVDGDGVDDLAVADSGNIVILRAQAVLP